MTEEEIRLADGARVLIRPIEPGDRDELRAGFERLSPESRYRRFFGPMMLSRFAPRRAGPPDRARLRDTVVVGTDGSGPARAAVRCAAGLAPALGVSVELVAVHWPLLGDREAMEDALRDAAAELRASGVEVTVHARRGDPAASLMDVAEETRARMIVIGPRSEAAASRLLLGSVGETVAAHVPCDVLIVRERA